MLISEILSQARDIAVDTDSTNPYTTDAKVYAMVSNWLHDLGLHVGYPRKQQSITFAADAGGAANTKNLDDDLGAIIIAVWRDTAGGSEWLLNPRTEAEMAAQDPNWRDLASGPPAYPEARIPPGDSSPG